MKRYGWIALAVAALDQAIKAYIRTIPQGYTFFEIHGLLALTHCVNTGAAFSMLSERTFLLTIVSVMLLAAISMYMIRKMHLTRAVYMALAFVLGGGIGNLIDRLLWGGVTDYIRLLVIQFPVFNLADIAITVGIAVLMILLMTDNFEVALEDQHGSDR